jgi:hypothetical protein
MNFAVDVAFPHAAGNQLRILGTKVKDEYFLMHDQSSRTDHPSVQRAEIRPKIK